MKKMILINLLLALFFLNGCGEDEKEIEPPTNVQFTADISDDKSGKVVFNISADNATYYVFFPGASQSEIGVESETGIFEYTYAKSGDYTAKVYIYYADDLFVTKKLDISVETNIEAGYALVWSDEFDTDGAPNDENWNYDIGTGSDGWGNNEDQYYTSREENVKVEDGVLKIIAKSESYEGSAFTSSRLLTKDKFEFTYGKVEVRAKLPQGGGTWPAIWMLGANIESVGWPECGEIDIMEHVGNNEGTVSTAIHTNSSFGATQNYKATTVENVTSEFHVYGLEWTEDKLIISVDSVNFYTYTPASKGVDHWPFNKDCFIILNIAIGGTLGGTVATDFKEGIMEIDYVRVYQE